MLAANGNTGKRLVANRSSPFISEPIRFVSVKPTGNTMIGSIVWLHLSGFVQLDNAFVLKGGYFVLFLNGIEVSPPGCEGKRHTFTNWQCMDAFILFERLVPFPQLFSIARCILLIPVCVLMYVR